MSDTAAPAASAPSAPVESSSSSAPETTSTATPVDAGSSSPKATPTETPAERKARVLKYKVDGAEREVNFDEMSDEKIIKQWQMAEAAQKRMQEAAEERKKVASVLEFIKKDPRAALADPAIGLDLDKLVEQRFAEKYQEAMMTDEQKKQSALEKKLREYEERENTRAQREKETQQAELERKVQEEMTRDFNEALQKYELPQSKETLMMMAEIARLNLDHGIELTPAQMAAEVKERLGGINRTVISKLKGEQLVKYLGDDVVKEIINYSVAKVKQAKAGPAQPAVTPGPNLKQEKTTGNPVQDFKRFIRGY